MDEVCRLCCSLLGVTNNIFDEDKSTYLKLSTCLPVKVSKGDRLPQKICNRCCFRLDQFYAFCNEALNAQTKLRESIKLIESVKSEIDLTESEDKDFKPLNFSIQSYEKATQTCADDIAVEKEEVIVSKVKQEVTLDVKNEDILDKDVKECDNLEADFVPSDYSDDISLLVLKKKKKKLKKDKEKVNGEVKKKKKRKDYELRLTQKSELDNGVEVKREWMNVNELLETSLKNFEIEEVYYCCICFLQIISKSGMIAHYRTHANDSGSTQEVTEECEDTKNNDAASFKCKVCDKKFETKSDLIQHVSVHDDGRPFRCSLCEKTFRDANQIFRHGQTHSYETLHTTPVAECVVRGCETARRGELCPDEHLVVRHKSQPKPLNKRFVCDLCDEGFVYMRYLMSHRSRAHPEAAARALVHRCMHCGREFAHLNSLRRHLRAHTGEKNYLCNVCGKALSSREHLKFHIRIHTGFKPNVCKTCGKGFVKKCNLTLHERVHSGEKPHVCSHCGKAFSQRSTLVIHERYHSGARPYVCTLCGKGFVAKGLLSMHLKTTCI